MSNQDDELTEERFWAILAAMPEPQPVSHRLYHDPQGRPLFYSTEDVPGTYIEITPEQYAISALNVRVEKGQLVTVTWTTSEVLELSDTGTPCHPQNVAIVVPPDQPHRCWSKKTYEQKN